MGLSIEKLRILLKNLSFICSKIYVLDGYCFYIEVISLKTSDVFLLYIPSKYEFKIDDSLLSNTVFKIKLLEVDETNDGEIGEHYDANIRLKPAKDEDMNEHLETQYKHDITLKDISKDDNFELVSILKQLKRLRYSVQNIKYKMAITYKNFICLIRRDDSIECYHVKHFPKDPNRRLLITTDLEMLYGNTDQLDYDIPHIQNEIYKVLEKNQNLHTSVIDSILESKNDVMLIANKMQAKRTLYEDYYNRLTKMMEQLIQKEMYLDDEMKRIEQPTINSLYSDYDIVNKRKQIQDEIYEVVEIKKECSRLLNIIKINRENILLNIDKLMFDNTVMFDHMIKNFKKLKMYAI